VISNRLKIGIAVATVTVVGVAGVAAAAWQSTASGTEQLHGATATNSTITAVSSVSLYPGAAKTALVTIDNPNPYPVIVTGLSAGSSTVQTGGLGTCAAGSATSDAKTPAGGAAAVLQSDGVTTSIAPNGSGTYQLATHMLANADNGCQGLTFNVAVTATVESNA
jgi:hypothetical protein